MTPRQFATTIGILLAIAGILALAWPVTGDYDTGLFGVQSADCGSAFSADTGMLSGGPLTACQDALSTRRAWTWPLFLVGVVVLAGAALIRTPRPTTHPQSATPGGTDTST